MKMAPNEHEFHESDEKFLAPGAATSSNTALQRGGLVAEPVSRRCSRLTFSSLDDVRQHLASPAKMAPNEHEFHASDEKFLAPGAATSSNTAL
ncbi:MAG TPA: hypothetical protein PK832_05890, partial [Anaerolineae bacterium]|nr:hypothetical protein [Anaerolineae bacterium]